MLSKSQARLFFLIFTIGFSIVFLLLTVDTIRKVPKQTNSDKITEAVVRGKRIWEHNYCMGCHTIFGEGAYYAPELTQVIDRRGKEWIKVFLKDPQAMFPGERKMTNYHFSDGQIDDLLAFFEWSSKVDLNGFPPKPVGSLVTASGKKTSGFKTVGLEEPEIYKALCVACHSLGGNGGSVGPALDGVGDRFDSDYFAKWLKDPQAVIPGTTMPNLQLSDSNIDSLVAFLASQK